MDREWTPVTASKPPVTSKVLVRASVALVLAGQSPKMAAPAGAVVMHVDVTLCGVTSCDRSFALDIVCGNFDVTIGDVAFGKVAFADVAFGNVVFVDVTVGDVAFGDAMFDDVWLGDVASGGDL